MKSLRKITATAVCFFFAISALADNNSLVGRWRSLKPSDGGIGSIFEFREEGKVSYGIGAVVETTYRIEGGEVVLPPATKNGPEQRQTITWSGENRFRLSPTATEAGVDFVRQGKGAESARSIVGEWRGEREIAGAKVGIVYLFRPNGTALLLMPFRTVQGTYSTDAGRLHLAWPNCPIPDSAFMLEEDQLVLTLPDSTSIRYQRY